MNQLARFGLILGAICLVATLVLAVTYEVTRPKIEEQLKKEEYEALKSVMPDADSFTEKSVDDIDYFEAKRGSELIGYCVRTVGNGYGGFIRMVVGIDASGTVKAVEIIEHYETPGLGSKVDETKPGERDPWFLRQFKGKHASTLAVKKNIDAITGATISSKAVTDAVRDTVVKFLAAIKK